MVRFKYLVWFILLAGLMIVLYPREGKFEYEYQKGRPWLYETLISPIDFPILKTEDEILSEKEEKSKSVIDFYNFDSNIASICIKRFRDDLILSSLPGKLIPVLTSDLDDAFEHGILADFHENNQDVIFVKKDHRVIEVPATEVYTIDVIYEKMLSDMKGLLPGTNVDSLARASELKSYIVPNLLFDEQMTQSLHKDAVSYISPTKGIIYSGQLIISQGEIVTADLCQILDSFKKEYMGNFGFSGSPIEMWAGHLLMAFSMVLMLVLSIFFSDASAMFDSRRLSFILLLTIIVYCATVFVNSMDQKLLFLVPFAAIVLTFNAFFKDNIVNVVYVVMLLPLLVIPEQGIQLFVINAVAGEIALFTYSRFNRGWLQFIIAVVVFVAMLGVSEAFALLDGKGPMYIVDSREMFYLAINSLFVIVLYPFTFIFEKLFGFVSQSRLRDLADTNTPLLQELRHKAPGTFQHSLQVANLAENAGRAIGVNDLLIRVGALYHDIGKMENPAFFIENTSSGENCHNGLSPEESAQEIIRHVDDGIVLARKRNLPSQVIGFIETHHGTALVTYFYNVYCNKGGDPENKTQFTYRGRIPNTKEEVIVMLADSVEAASRTLHDYTNESVANLVGNIIRQKLSDGQLADAGITFRELRTVAESFTDFILQMYHKRIVYPKRKEKKQ